MVVEEAAGVREEICHGALFSRCGSARCFGHTPRPHLSVQSLFATGSCATCRLMPRVSSASRRYITWEREQASALQKVVGDLGGTCRAWANLKVVLDCWVGDVDIAERARVRPGRQRRNLLQASDVSMSVTQRSSPHAQCSVIQLLRADQLQAQLLLREA